MTERTRAISEADKVILTEAFRRLEEPSYAIRLSSALGCPVGATLSLLPARLVSILDTMTRIMIRRTFEFGVCCLASEKKQFGPQFKRRLCTLTGALGGFVGGAGTLIEIPISTSLMLASIAEIAKSEGEDLQCPETRFACLSVFAMGGLAKEDDDANYGYYSLRMALQAPINEATRFLAAGSGRELMRSPAVIHLIHLISKRFGVALSRRTLGMMVPMLGAAAGAACNRMFIDHLQDMARCHFTIRRLERKYSSYAVERFYLRITKTQQTRSPYRLPAPPKTLEAMAA